MKNHSEFAAEKMRRSKPAETGVACTPTSVIVKSVREPKPVTENLIQTREPRVVTEVLFATIETDTEEERK